MSVWVQVINAGVGFYPLLTRGEGCLGSCTAANGFDAGVGLILLLYLAGESWLTALAVFFPLDYGGCRILMLRATCNSSFLRSFLLRCCPPTMELLVSP